MRYLYLLYHLGKSQNKNNIVLTGWLKTAIKHQNGNKSQYSTCLCLKLFYTILQLLLIFDIVGIYSIFWETYPRRIKTFHGMLIMKIESEVSSDKLVWLFPGKTKSANHSKGH